MNITFEDDQILVVEKEAGVVVNRSQTIREETLQDQLSSYFKLGSGLGIGARAGIVHRLDRGTSGLLVVAKTQNAFERLQEQFRLRQVKKEYLALVHGFIKEKSGSIVGKIGRIGKFGKFGLAEGGREAITDFELINLYRFRENNLNNFLTNGNLNKAKVNYLKNHAEHYSMLKLLPKSGRTHQIRVHIKSIGHPAVSDLLYTPRKLLKFDLLWCPRLFLHSMGLEIIHPASRKPVKFTSDLPKDLKASLSNLTIAN